MRIQYLPAFKKANIVLIIQIFLSLKYEGY